MAFSFKKVAQWVGRRLKEKSTYAGLAVVAGALGLPEVEVYINHASQVAVIVFGAGLAAASTKPRTIEDLLGR